MSITPSPPGSARAPASSASSVRSGNPPGSVRSSHRSPVQVKSPPSSRPASVSGWPSSSQDVPSTRGSTSRQSGSRPRQSSILNPEHGRSPSVNLQAPTTLPVRPAAVPSWMTTSINDAMKRTDQLSPEALRDKIKMMMQAFKFASKPDKWKSYKENVDNLQKARVNNDTATFDQIISNLKAAGTPAQDIVQVILMAYATSHLWKMKTILVPWPTISSDSKTFSQMMHYGLRMGRMLCMARE